MAYEELDPRQYEDMINGSHLGFRKVAFALRIGMNLLIWRF